MNLQELQNKITEISKGRGIHEQEIINNLLATLNVNYSEISYDSEDVEIIKEVKEKIMTTLFAKSNHKTTINRATKFDLLFGLDKIENGLLNRAFEELEADADVYSLQYEIGLTEQGIRKQR